MGLVDEERPVGLLVHEHGGLVGPKTGAREREVANHPKSFLPDSRPAARADRECFLDTGEQRLHD